MRKTPESKYDIPVKYSVLFVDYLGNFGKRIETVYVNGNHEFQQLLRNIESWNITTSQTGYPKYQYKFIP